MAFYVVENCEREQDIIALNNLDYAEDKIIELCENLESGGVHSLEIASGLLFTAHYLLTQESKNNAKRYYKYLLKQCREQLNALPELLDSAQEHRNAQNAS